MKQCWRWFGPDDPVTLSNVVQAGATGVVSSLHEVATGEVWQARDIQARKLEIESHGLQWSVVESLPVHNDIKTHLKSVSHGYTEFTRDYARGLTR